MAGSSAYLWHAHQERREVCRRGRAALVLAAFPDSLCPPAELVVLVEVFRWPGDAAESVGDRVPHGGGAEGLGGTAGGGGVTGPPAPWEGRGRGRWGVMEVGEVKGPNCGVGGDSESSRLTPSGSQSHRVPLK